MQPITSQPSLVDQVYEAILSEIMDGKFSPDARLVQEALAETFGVSGQPVQQALLLLRSQGILTRAPGRVLMVSGCTRSECVSGIEKSAFYGEPA